MCQRKVLEFLKINKNKWYRRKEIGERLEIGQGTITVTLKKLRDMNWIEYKKQKTNTWFYLYKHKENGLDN